MKQEIHERTNKAMVLFVFSGTPIKMEGSALGNPPPYTFTNSNGRLPSPPPYTANGQTGSSLQIIRTVSAPT